MKQFLILHTLWDTPDNLGHKITAAQAHLIYWDKALHLTIGIVYDPVIKKAFWIDITSYLSKHPQVLQQRYHTIRLEDHNEFSEETFPAFIDYCIRFKEVFSSYEKYGRALEWFGDMTNPGICYEGLKSLYSNHREKPSTWFYIVSNFSKIEQEGIRGNILGMLSNYVNPYIFWNQNSIQSYPSNDSERYLSQLMTKYFRKKEVELVIPYMEQGITRGSYSYLVFLVINMVEDIHLILKDIAFNSNISNDKRNFCFWLYLQTAKFHSLEETLNTANEYLKKYPCGNEDEAIVGVIEAIENGELWPIG